MASNKSFLDFILGQLAALPDITYRAMMGEFIIYYRGKIVGGIYDNRLLVKPTAATSKLMPNAPMEIPFPGGKPMPMVQDIEDVDFLTTLFDAIYAELPNPKQKLKGQGK